MNYKVVYFTRTGNSERIATKIATKLSCETVQIKDNIKWEGPIGFIKGGYYSTFKKDVAIQHGGIIEEDDILVVISPLWAGGITPAIKKFLQSISCEDVHLVISSDGSITKDRSGYKSVTDIVKNQDNEDHAIEVLINESLRLK